MNGRLLGVVSGKGGVGKTMLTAALGAGWALRGKRVVLVDLCTGMRGLDMPLGLQSRVSFDLGDVLDGVCGLDRAMVTDSRTGVRLVAAKQFGETKLSERPLRIILEVLTLQNDFVLLDTGSGLSEGARTAFAMADTVLLMTEPDDAALRATERVLSLAQTPQAPRPLLVINRLDEELQAQGLHYSPETCAQLLDLRLAGTIPEDAQARRAMLEKEPLQGDGPAAQAVREISELVESSGIL